jgi:hypothetical protein
MNSKVIKTEVRLARGDHNEVNIYLKDEASRAVFVELKLSLEELGLLVTGKILDDIPCEVKGLDNIGKVKVQESRSMIVTEGHPLYTKRWDSETLSYQLKTFAHENGWTVNPYLGSRGSIMNLDDGFELNYSVYKYVDPEE